MTTVNAAGWSADRDPVGGRWRRGPVGAEVGDEGATQGAGQGDRTPVLLGITLGSGGSAVQRPVDPVVDADGGDSDSDDGGELNPKESTPAPADMTAVPSDTVFTQVAATDNATFALTSTGRVYGWGTFRVSHQHL